MTKPNDGGPAYPQSIDPQGPFGGLTKREAFAMAAMQGLLSNPEYTGQVPSRLSVLAVEQADALLAELNKE